LLEYATSKGQKAVAISGDLTKEADANAMIKKTVDALGGIDILINNAGTTIVAGSDLLPSASMATNV